MLKKLVFLAGVSLLATSASAQTSAEAAKLFGAREAVQQISLSPDGKSIAILTPTADRGMALAIVGPERGVPKPVLASTGDPERLTDCGWVTGSRLVCNIFLIANDGMENLGFTRVVAIDSDGSNQKMLSTRTNPRSLRIIQQGGSVIDWLGDGASSGSLLMTSQYVPEQSIGTRLASKRDGLGVDRVDARTGTHSPIEAPERTAVDYVSDGYGAIRIRGLRPTDGVYDGGTVNYHYRLKDSREWRPLGAYSVTDGVGFNPYAIDRDLDVVYGFDRHDGRQALFRIALDGSEKRELVFARPDVDVDGLVRIGRQHRVVGVSFATDRRETEFFDPELMALRKALARALPDLPLISFVDASADEKKLLLFAGSDVDPGRYYLFDKTTRQLEEILPVRPPLQKVALAAVQAISFPAADGTKIPAYLTLPPGAAGKNIPAIVMPHGGPGARDEWGFDWLAQFFANRGFAVLQPNFRGSSGYGEQWFQENGFKSWRTAIGDVNDGGRWLVEQGIANPARLGIVGWSYGGYSALQSAVLDPDLFKAIVAIAPVTDLEMLRQESRYFTNYKIVDAFIGSGPHVREGSPAQNAARIKAPVLMFHGDLDRNVEIGESRLMASKLKEAGKTAELVEFKGLDHQLDDSSARAQMLEKADGFLRAAMGM